MTLARNFFTTLAFHAKTHNMLTHGSPIHPETRRLASLQDQIAREIRTVMEKIDEKEHEHNSDELQSLKKLVIDLRKEFDVLKKVGKKI